ncbi:hypothetical protein DASC09_003930 [Saccharomycopsis crataegensis]|uniref:Homeobox domain-containing protein n=1 Tax=Saccharomycopsis crataegensis TaxID=43959 RepID=A0AAV5QE87_9ASCO|nr:hypothetical protein DASC09_003930 [Saccharomycopsis crataegensis]
MRNHIPPNAIHGQIILLQDVYLIPQCQLCKELIHINGKPAAPIREEQLMDQFSVASNNEVSVDLVGLFPKSQGFRKILPKESKKQEYLGFIISNYVSNIAHLNIENGLINNTGVDKTLWKYFKCQNSDCGSYGRACNAENQVIWETIFEMITFNTLTRAQSTYAISSGVLIPQFQPRSSILKKEGHESLEASIMLSKFFAPWIRNKSLYLFSILDLIEERENEFFFFIFGNKVKSIEQGLCPFIPRHSYSNGTGIIGGLQNDRAGLQNSIFQKKGNNHRKPPQTKEIYKDVSSRASGWNSKVRTSQNDNMMMPPPRPLADSGQNSPFDKNLTQQGQKNHIPENEKPKESFAPMQYFYPSCEEKSPSQLSDLSDLGEESKNVEKIKTASTTTITTKTTDLPDDKANDQDELENITVPFSSLPIHEFLPSRQPTANGIQFDDHKLFLEWLFYNLKDPYPGIDVVSNFIQKTGLSKRQVHSWFSKARTNKVPRMKAVLKRLKTEISYLQK